MVQVTNPEEHEPNSLVSPKNLLSGKLVSNTARQWLSLCKSQGRTLDGSMKQIAACSSSEQIDKLNCNNHPNLTGHDTQYELQKVLVLILCI